MIASGYDFYSTPRVSPDGTRLAWLSWRHPQMPWDGTELWVANLTGSGALDRAVRVAGGPTESIYQPGWSPDGTLYFVSDRDGWWKLYRGDYQPAITNPPAEAEFGRPQWTFDTTTWAFAGPSRIVVSYTTRGRWYLAAVDVATGVMSSLADGVEPREWLTATPSTRALRRRVADLLDAIARIDLTSAGSMY